MRFIYNAFLYLLLPFLPLRLLWRSRKNSAYRHRIFERFGFYKFLPLKESIWLHAASVGESIAAIPLIRELLKKYPKIPIVVTAMTPTGAQRIKDTFKNEVIQLYVPYDYPCAVKQFLKQIKPKVLVLMESELWPNILYYTKKQNIPIILASARISAGSFANYKKVAGFTKENLSRITKVSAQSKLDAERLLALGLDPKKLVIGGNVKFDIKVSDNVLTDGKKLRKELSDERPVWIAASTHNGEEEKVLVAAKKVLEVFPNALLILVPRHMERFDQVFELCRNQGFEAIRYSKQEKVLLSTNILLGDVMGKVLMFYAAGDVAFVGGSLIKWGGHNVLEPAALAKPVLSGPNLSAFVEISQLLTDANALIKVNDEFELGENLIKLFQDKGLREKLGAAALNVVEKHRGATGRILELIAAEI
jgi:3-deoxy-D-manno-octulosonic-acid transferase